MNKFFAIFLIFIVSFFLTVPNSAFAKCADTCQCECSCCDQAKPDSNTDNSSNHPCLNNDKSKDKIKTECCENCPCCQKQKTDN